MLLNNLSGLSKNNEDYSRRIIGHIIGTFTSNIRKTLKSYRASNELAFIDDVSGIQNYGAGRLFLSGFLGEYSKEKRGFEVLFIDDDNLKRYNNI
ncbi:MAG: hypothetical protein GX895_00335 [Clostridiales bacterium]|nr:hypothetical protein [Clostridiales bacterium]